MHQALYRKYRPRTFDDVWGQEHITSVLAYESHESRFSHAYLFCGPRGTGKTSCAKILAKALNCTDLKNGSPCGECDACRMIDEGIAPDVLEMDAASNNGVDYIRDIRDEVNYTPAALKKRVYIIDEVHMLSSGAFNALLKTLEEPPEHVVFILATTEFHKLPATIVSRCQRFDFRRIKSDVLAKRLLYIAEKESMTLDEDAATILAKQAQGGMRDAISLFELCAAGGHDVTAEHVRDVLGLTGIEILYKTAVAVARADTATLFSTVGTVDSSSKDITVYWSELIGFWRDMLVMQKLPESERRSYFDLTEPEMRLLADAARRFTSETLSYHFTLLDDAMREMARLPQTKRLSAELTLIRMSDTKLDTSNTALLSRISALEEKIALLSSGVQCVPTPAPSQTADEKPAETTEDTRADAPAPIEEKPTESMNPVADLGEVVERIGEQNPSVSGFFSDCDCFVSDDRRRVLIRTTSDFAKNILLSDSAMKTISSVLCVCGIAEAGAAVTVETGAVPKEKNPIDDLADF